MTLFEKITQSPEALAEWLDSWTSCDDCPACPCVPRSTSCSEAWEKKLNEEVE